MRLDLEAVVFGRIMTRRDDDSRCAIMLFRSPTHGGRSYERCRELHGYPRRGEHSGRQFGKSCAFESGIVAYDGPQLIRVTLMDPPGRCASHTLDVLKSVGVGDDGAPAVG